MRPLVVLFPGLLVACLVSAAACSGSDSSPSDSSDAAAADTSTSPRDAAQDTSELEDAGADTSTEKPTIADEMEPNGGQPATAVNAMVLPGTMNGKIDPANDSDVFSIKLAPGDFWDWTLTPTGADLAPHMLAFDTAGGLNPTVAGFAAAGAPAKLQHFVLRTGTFVIAVRDARNVGAAGNKGGPTYGYALTAKRATPNPVAVTLPTTKTGKLGSVGSVDFYSFGGTNGKGWDVAIHAEKKAVPSTLDSRLTIWDMTGKKPIGTNDNLPSSTDSKLGSADPVPGGSTFLAIVENEGKDGTDLSYEIEFTLR